MNLNSKIIKRRMNFMRPKTMFNLAEMHLPFLLLELVIKEGAIS